MWLRAFYPYPATLFPDDHEVINPWYLALGRYFTPIHQLIQKVLQPTPRGTLVFLQCNLGQVVCIWVLCATLILNCKKGAVSYLAVFDEMV